jgi:hypothetical protein
MVVGVLTIELFFKCLIFIETGTAPRGHRFKELFDQLSSSTQARIQDTWDNWIVVHRTTEWNRLENALGITIARDLPSALEAGSDAFQKIRYSYEGGTENLKYYLQDLPQLLRRVIVEMRPELKGLERRYQQLLPPSRRQG